MNKESVKLSFQQKLDRMIGMIRLEILNGSRSPGSFLPSESSLAKQFQISNKTVRKGLDVLVGEGLIIKIDRVGSMVTKERKTVRLHFGCNPTLFEDIALSTLLDAFHARYPLIQVRAIPLDFFGHVTSAREMLAGGLLDVVSFNNTQFQELAEEDGGEALSLLEPLEPDMGLYSAAEETFRHNGQLYARAVSFSPVVLCYNRAHFREAGLPEPDSSWSWDDLIGASRRLAAFSGRHAVYFVPTSLNRYPLFLLQSGPGSGSDSNTAAGLRPFTELVNDHTIFPKYFSGTSEDDSLSLFKEERVSMILTTYFGLNAFRDLPLSYDISPVPLMNKGKAQRTLLLSIGIAVNRSSGEKEAAHAFARFLASPEAQGIIREQRLSIPARRESAEVSASQGATGAPAIAGALNRPSRYAMYKELFPTFRAHQELGIPMSVLKEFGRTLKEYWSGMIDGDTLNIRLESLLHGSQK
ncbi:extracellular solute-binding protein [Paenibacillus dakarensis]|uniref:extracellular solute-binding protein n=1 Tax=Paenibacillus dakarensis TaxID=1527293 RepID=UPI0006D5B125|nr:extracellular solute-binding protein [Paenibacillus dakarensis]